MAEEAPPAAAPDSAAGDAAVKRWVACRGLLQGECKQPVVLACTHGGMHARVEACMRAHGGVQ